MKTMIAAILLLATASIAIIPTASADPYACQYGVAVAADQPLSHPWWLHMCLEGSSLRAVCGVPDINCYSLDSSTENNAAFIQYEACRFANCATLSPIADQVWDLIP